ncbi:hypothetical protein O6H91_21G047200 [Diphasiastrum complanatum]|uniref:Uncharacterized protein n=1 Tax=Diphasiastrum complanatum TaxID=34168 RepID=A0ACC2AKG5_DIPCM|nr:hypothetical protein O6H91_21G047200 [Diphasiastrum complanatum]
MLHDCLPRVVEFFERQAKIGPRTPLLIHSGGRAVVKHPLPLNFCMPPWSLGQDFYDIVKFGIVQYMILKTVCAFLALILELFGVYGDGEFKWYYGYPYITVVLNFSQTWALYCLVQFYSVTKDELQSIKPLAKFICFKSIVFATWWQGVFIAVIFGSGGDKTLLPVGAKFQSSLQDFIICLEMAAAAVAHIYIFPAAPYQLVDDHVHRGVSVLADYASWDSPLDPEEVKESERTPILRFLPSDTENVATSLRASFQDVVFVGGEQVVNDVKTTMSQAVEPMEKGINRLNERLHNLPWGPKHKEKEKRKHTKDDNWLLASSGSEKPPIRGIDDPLLTGSVSDSVVARGRRQREPHGNGADSSGESSDQGVSGFKTSGRRWTVRR